LTGSAKTLSRPGPLQLGPQAELGFAGDRRPNPPAPPPNDALRGALKESGPEGTGGVKDKELRAGDGAGAGATNIGSED